MDTCETSDIGNCTVSDRDLAFPWEIFDIRISMQLIQNDRKSILNIRGMDPSLVGPYLCQTNQSVSTIILQLMSMNI